MQSEDFFCCTATNTRGTFSLEQRLGSLLITCGKFCDNKGVNVKPSEESLSKQVHAGAQLAFWGTLLFHV